MLSIVYVNYNTSDLLLASINSVTQFLKLDHEIIVVDNASSSSEIKKLAHLPAKIKLIKNDSNLGFGRANNIGAEHSRGSYIWLLNTDTLLTKDSSIEQVTQYLDDHPTCGAAGPLLVNGNGEVQPGQTAYFPTLWRLLLNAPSRRLAGASPSLRKLLSGVNSDYLPLQAMDIDVLVAASLLVKRSVFESVGGFSPEFFMFYEDTDLCKKIHQAGYSVHFVPAAKITHLWGKSISQPYTRKKLYYSSQDVYLAKWHGKLTAGIIAAARIPLLLYYRLNS